MRSRSNLTPKNPSKICQNRLRWPARTGWNGFWRPPAEGGLGISLGVFVGGHTLQGTNIFHGVLFLEPPHLQKKHMVLNEFHLLPHFGVVEKHIEKTPRSQ